VQGGSKTAPLVILALSSLLPLALFSCRTTLNSRVKHEDQRSIVPEIELLNTAAYPEETYTVLKGDTPRSIAEKMRVEYSLLVQANDLTAKSVLKPGQLLVIPRIRPRSSDPFIRQAPSRAYAEAGPPPPRPAAAQPARAAVTSQTAGGEVRAVAPGTVTEIHRGYPNLGDVVIIEGGSEKVVYSGAFTPAVAPGEVVTEGAPIATGASGPARTTRFAK
jgi:LysM repeat protein